MSNSFLFELPEIADHPKGWGPTGCVSIFQDVPFAPYNKGDRLGRISDWTQSRGRGRAPQTYGQGSSSSFAYKHDEDESSFSLVDNKPKLKPQYRRFNKQAWVQKGGRGGGQQQQQGRGAWGNQQQQGGRGGRGGMANNRNNRNARGGRGGRQGYNRNYGKEETSKEPSVAIDEKWESVAVLDIEDLGSEKYNPGSADDLFSCGSLARWNEQYDRVTPKQPKQLMRFETREHYAATTSADPYIKRISVDQEKAKQFTVYATDNILALLMSVAKSVNPWDILVRKTATGLYFDKRSDTKCVDFLNVNENLKDNNSNYNNFDKESINSPENLSIEATTIAHNLAQQVVHGDQVKELENENPLTAQLRKGEKPFSTAFRYRKWDLGGEQYSLVARTQVHGYIPAKTPEDEDTLVVTKVFNEFDSKLSGTIDWRQKLESQTGAVLAAEMKNNAHRLSRMTAETFLSGADIIQVGFVTRVQPTDSYRHSILMMRKFEPKVFATSVGVSAFKLWGTLKSIIDTCLAQEDGKYILMRDPNKAEVQLLRVQNDTWDDDLCVFKHLVTNESL